MPQTRTNAYGADVIFASDVPASSIGFDPRTRSFFEGLGSTRNDVGSGEQQAEQVYLLANMHKAGLWEASRIAIKNQVGIAVRGTGLLAHMGIESGNPTKAQEFKNKTSKNEDLYLCDWLDFVDVGSVIHYDPRVGWSPDKGARDAKAIASPPSRFCSLLAPYNKNPTLRPLSEPSDWISKEKHIRDVRIPQLGQQGALSRITPFDMCIDKVKSLFKKRVQEYLAEDAGYRPGGAYAAHCILAGVHITLSARPDAIMVGDHDLFGFTDPKSDCFLADDIPSVRQAQADLQASNGFQAQHGGIWNWQPPEPKNLAIKDVIMGAHGPDKNEPLVYFKPNGGGCEVMAAFYVKEWVDKVKSVWAYPGNQTWRV